MNVGDEASTECVVLGRIPLVRANIMLTHIRRPERAKRLSELTFSDALRNTRFESKSTKGTITRPYAHAGLAPGEVQTGKRSDETFDFSLDSKAFRENVAET